MLEKLFRLLGEAVLHPPVDTSWCLIYRDNVRNPFTTGGGDCRTHQRDNRWRGLGLAHSVGRY